MVGDGALTFREFAMREPLPLATIHDAVLDFLRGRDDAALFGAQAVNAYVDESRMTQDVHILSPRARKLADEIKTFLNEKFHIAVRDREVREGEGYRIYQVKKPGNRHLVDVRQIEKLPPVERVSDLLVISPPELIANKVIAREKRRDTPKSGTDWRDLAVLLLTFPELKRDPGPVRDRLEAAAATPAALAAWKELVAQHILPENEDSEFDGP
jgi:hypothetical protein